MLPLKNPPLSLLSFLMNQHSPPSTKCIACNSLLPRFRLAFQSQMSACLPVQIACPLRSYQLYENHSTFCLSMFKHIHHFILPLSTDSPCLTLILLQLCLQAYVTVVLLMSGVVAVVGAWCGNGRGRRMDWRSCPAWEVLVKLCLQDSVVTREHEAKVPLLYQTHKVREFIRGSRGLQKYFSSFSLTCFKSFLCLSNSPERAKQKPLWM